MFDVFKIIMNWGGFQSLSHLWLLALFAPLVLFYFLKLKRPRAEIPSLVLWRQVLQDHRVNSPFQKFKRNLLLLLQILLLLFPVSARVQPFWRRRAGQKSPPAGAGGLFREHGCAGQAGRSQPSR